MVKSLTPALDKLEEQNERALKTKNGSNQPFEKGICYAIQETRKIGVVEKSVIKEIIEREKNEMKRIKKNNPNLDKTTYEIGFLTLCIIQKELLGEEK